MDRNNHFSQDGMFDSEHRLIFRRGGGGWRQGGAEYRYNPGQNPDQNNRQNTKPQPVERRYHRDERLKAYAKKNKERFMERMGKIEKKVNELDKGQGVSKATKQNVENMKKYFNGAFKEWIEHFENLRKDNADALEHGLSLAEREITRLEGEVYVEEDKGRFQDLPDGKTFERRVKESRVEESLANGSIEAHTRSDGMQYMYVPSEWSFFANSGGKITGELAISGGLKQIQFQGKPGMKFDIHLPEMAFKKDIRESVITTDLVAAGKDGMKLDLTAVKTYLQTQKDNAVKVEKKEKYVEKQEKRTETIKTKIETFEKPKVERLKKEAKDGIARPKIQQDPDLAMDIVTDIQNKIWDAEEALAAGTITQAEHDQTVEQLNTQLTIYRREFDQKDVQTIVRALREGKMTLDSDELKTRLQKVKNRFERTYGTAGDSNKTFEGNHYEQLLRGEDEQPFIMKHNGEGNLTFEKNPKYETRNKMNAASRNTELAANKLAGLFEIALEKGDDYRTLGKKLIAHLKSDNAKNAHGVYLANAHLYERDDTLIGTDEIIIRNFENMLQSDPINALKEMGANTTSLEAAKAKTTMEKSRTTLAEYEQNRDRMPEEVDAALAEITNLTNMLRGSLATGQFGDAEQALVKQINTRLWNDVKGIDYDERIVNAVGEMKTYTAPDGKTFDMTYDAADRKVAVKTTNPGTGGRGQYSRLGPNPV